MRSKGFPAPDCAWVGVFRSRLQIPTIGVSWGATGTIPSMILEYMDVLLCAFLLVPPLLKRRGRGLLLSHKGFFC